MISRRKRYRFPEVQRIAGVIILWTFLILVGCSSVVQQVRTSLGLDPEQGLEMALTRTPAQWEEAKARAAAVDPKVTKGMKLNRDPALNKRLQTMVDRLQAVSHAPQIPFRIKIIESEQINAFNTGGELVYVYTGLINDVKSDDELAGILAHEMGHGIGAHLQREQRSMFLPSIGAAITSIALQNKNADQVIGLVNQAASSGYSRRHEREADILAVVYTYRAGYNPLSFEDFFQRIRKRADQVKQKKEKGLRKNYVAYQQTAQNLERKKRDFAISNSNLQKHPHSRQARNQFQRARVNLQKGKKEHDRQYMRYQKSYQSYAQAVSQLFPIFQSHPADPERVDIITSTYQYLKGEIPLAQTPSSVQYIMPVVEKIGR